MPAAAVHASATAAGRRVASTVATCARGRSRACSCSHASSGLLRLAGAHAQRHRHLAAAPAAAACARCQCRDRSSATGPLMPKCVHSSDPVSAIIVAAAHAQRQRGRMRSAGQARMSVARPGPAAPGPAWSARSCDRATAPGRSPCRRSRSWATNARRSPAPLRRHRRCAPSASSAANDSWRLSDATRRARLHGDPQAPGLSQQRIEHRASPIRIGEQLAVLFLVERDAQLLEERGGAGRGKRAQHVPHDARRPAPEVVLRHGAVGDVAAGAAADQDLRADVGGAVQAHDAQPRRRTSGEDGASPSRRPPRRQPRRPTPPAASLGPRVLAARHQHDVAGLVVVAGTAGGTLHDACPRCARENRGWS